MVTNMDERARAIFDEARATLARTAHVKVEYRSHRDDGYSSDWAKGMPPKPAPPTIEEVRREIAAALAEHDEVWREVHGAVIAQERKLWRDEVARMTEEIGLLRSGLAVAKAHDGQGRSEVVEVPQLLERRRA
ncbi:hypothetical protein [Bradyrhizobium sp. CCBAU 45389]|uniref:hypothetical protein n=1 Tax=Bradyrhizobium sp. CCBAU 45389 TaxID=858429 RepID=UPI002304D5DF|nr:hypothetical protein [Bradyrhizobium sp. CCBAU 45389]MDA9400776.1 hypothetical protein [Bradyrhizobium sp. CCBAU 45389]